MKTNGTGLVGLKTMYSLNTSIKRTARPNEPKASASEPRMDTSLADALGPLVLAVLAVLFPEYEE